MRLRVLYFAALRDLVQCDEESVDAPADVTTVDAFAQWIERHHAPLAGRLVAVRMARNERFARGDEVLAEGDVLALIPPVAGG